jgi:hypothetical protein
VFELVQQLTGLFFRTRSKRSRGKGNGEEAATDDVPVAKKPKIDA